MKCQKEFSVTVADDVLRITSPSSLPSVAAYDSWSYQLEAVSGTPPYSWLSIVSDTNWIDTDDASGLLTAQTNVLFNQLPRLDTFTMRVTDALGHTAQKAFTVQCNHSEACPNWAAITVSGFFISGTGSSFSGVLGPGDGDLFDTAALAVGGMKCSIGRLTWNWNITTVADARVQVVSNVGTLRTAGVLAASGSGSANLQFGVPPTATSIWLRFQVGGGNGVSVSGTVTNLDI